LAALDVVESCRDWADFWVVSVAFFALVVDPVDVKNVVLVLCGVDRAVHKYRFDEMIFACGISFVG
jgi:hypothetical protein